MCLTIYVWFNCLKTNFYTTPFPLLSLTLYMYTSLTSDFRARITYKLEQMVPGSDLAIKKNTGPNRTANLLPVQTLST